MNYKPIVIIAGEPNSIFLEIFFKSIKKNKFKSPLILIASYKLVILQMKKLKFKKKIRLLNLAEIKDKKLNNKYINLIDVNLYQNKAFQKISTKSKNYIEKLFDVGLDIFKIGLSNKLINGPISKKKFLNGKYPGITEYIANKINKKKVAMLIYNENLSVCPLSTHVPLKKITRYITRKNICEKVELLNNFFKKYKKIKPRIGVIGLNPHCESSDKFNEDEKILKPTIKYLSKLGYKISGPLPADTAFIKNNRKNFNVFLGMYHDQVLTPIKTIYEYDAINITLGLPFIRITPDHGPNETMLGKNKSNPLSLIQAIKFLDKN